MVKVWDGLLAAAMLWIVAQAAGAAEGQAVASFDFTKAEEVAAWKPTHDIAQLTATPEGMRIEIRGEDPYTVGGVRDLPPGQMLWLRIRLKSEQGGTGQVFYFTAQKGANEEDSVRFPVRAGVWEEIRVAMPALGPATH